MLFLTTRFPVPPWRGDQARAYHQLRELGRRHDITLLALLDREPSAAARAEVEGWGVRVQVVAVGRLGAIPALLRAVCGDPRPLQTLLYRRPAAQAIVRELMHRQRYDLVHAQLVRTAAYLPAGPTPPAVVDFVDALSANMQRRAARSHWAVRWLPAWEARRLSAFERALLARAAACVAVSAEDARLIGAGAVRVVPNGVDGRRFAFVAGDRPAPRLVFGGNLGYFPNVDAAGWLAEEILPLVRRAVPDAELTLVGARPSRAVRALARLPGVQVLADVPDMAAELAAGQVAVLPMRAGTGLQNKVLEAMAVGTPVVATGRAVAALGVTAGTHLLVADSAGDLAAAAVGLLRDPARRRTMAIAARELVESRYLWAEAAAELETIWTAVVQSDLEPPEPSDIPLL